MGDLINPGITGDTFDVEVNLDAGIVKVAGLPLFEADRKLAHIFLEAYKMGRNHKKMEIRKVLNLQ